MPQQVKQRVNNSESDRNYCLSWLKTNYELINGSSIEKHEMYQQYLNSQEKFSLKSVLSEQHFAVCVRYIYHPQSSKVWGKKSVKL